MSSPEVIVNPMIAVFDCVQNAMDMNAFVDYMKTNYKKEIIFLNAQDYAETSGRISKSESKFGMKTKHGGNQNIIRGLKSKIDGDYSKIFEAKKKIAAAIEKAKNSSKSGKSKSRLTNISEENQLFAGKIDVLYILLNYPYLPNQLNYLLEGGIELNVFISLIPKNGAENIPYQKKTSEKSSRTNQPKKVTIMGSELDWTQNPQCYPPARWSSLRPNAPPHVAFVEIPAEEEVEATFKLVEESLIKLAKAKNEFSTFFKDKSIIVLPPAIPNGSMFNFSDYMAERPGDVVNAIYYELHLNNFKPAQPPPPPPIQQQFEGLFSQGTKELERKVVFLEPHELSDIDFSFDIPPPLHPLLYKLFCWSLSSEKAATCLALSDFLGSPVNFYVYAGQKFDTLVQSVNKKYSLGLPLSFFDWSQWNYHEEYLKVGDALLEAVHNAGIIETYFDDAVGILWILALPPVPRTMGQFFTNYSMPPTIDGITEYISKIFDKNNGNEKKLRNPPSPAQVVRDSLDFNVLLPPVHNRMSSNNTLYRLPLSISNSASFTSPYFFESGLKLDIQRTLENEKMGFGYSFYYKSHFEVFATSSSIIIQPIEGIRIMIEKPLSITFLFNEQSFRYTRESIVVKSANELPIIITTDGTFIVQDKNNQQMIIQPNGTISRFINGQWRSCDRNGDSFVHTLNGIVAEETHHSEVVDLNTRMRSMIRPDNTEYYIKHDGTRRILFNLDFSIEQNEKENKTIYDISNYPVIQKEGDVTVIPFDRFELKFRENEASIVCPDYKINIFEDHTLISDNTTEMYLKTDHCEFKYEDRVIIADSNGIEKMCVINNAESPSKKKVEEYQSHWGRITPIKETLTEPQHVNLNKLFVPRFFAVRSDLTAAEFIRPDTLKMEGCAIFEDFITHPTGLDFNIISVLHPIHPPTVYFVNNPLNKAERANIMKLVHIPKPKKENKKSSQAASSKNEESEEEALSNAESARQSLFCNNKLFVQSMNNRLEKKQSQFEDESHPIENQSQDILILPPQTPPPRILEMAANIDLIRDHFREVSPNYWQSKESDFSMPLFEPKTLERPLSPRVALNDPPRFYRPEKSEEEVKDYPVTPPTVARSTHSANSSKAQRVTKQVNIRAEPDVINFGTVKPETRATANFTLTNVGSAPVHLVVGQSSNKLLKVLTVPLSKDNTRPCVVYPGLRLKLTVALEGAPAQYISASFDIKTKDFELKIPVTADVKE